MLSAEGFYASNREVFGACADLLQRHRASSNPLCWLRKIFSEIDVRPWAWRAMASHTTISQIKSHEIQKLAPIKLMSQNYNPSNYCHQSVVLSPVTPVNPIQQPVNNHFNPKFIQFGLVRLNPYFGWSHPHQTSSNHHETSMKIG